MKHPKFEIFKDKAGEWRWRLKAPNGRVIAASEGYKRKRSAERGAVSVQRATATARIVTAD